MNAADGCEQGGRRADRRVEGIGGVHWSVSWLARWIVRDDRAGCIYTMIVGVVGAIIGGGMMSIIDEEQGVGDFSIRSILVAALGAVVFLVLLQAIAGRGPLTRSR